MKKLISFAMVAAVLSVSSIGCGDAPKKETSKADVPKDTPKGNTKGVETERPRK